jgi:eukaryotic-like serine/threonine-protein kinase
VMIHHARTVPQPPSKITGRQLPDRLEEIVLSCLEKAPEKRPSSALELWHRLGEVALTPPWTPERAEGWWREHLPDLAKPTHGGDSSSELTVVPLQ